MIHQMFNSIKKSYRGENANNYDKARKNNPKWKFEEETLKNILSEIRTQISNILDLPVGTGRFLEMYNQTLKVPVYAVDLSEDMLKIARSRCENYNVAFSKADLIYGEINIQADLVVNYRFLNLVDWKSAKSALVNLLKASTKYLVFTIRTIPDDYSGEKYIEGKIYLHFNSDIIQIIEEFQFNIYREFSYKDERHGDYKILFCEKN